MAHRNETDAFVKNYIVCKKFVKLIIFKAGMNLLKHTNQYDLLLLFNHNQTINNRKEKKFQTFLYPYYDGFGRLLLLKHPDINTCLENFHFHLTIFTFFIRL